MARKVVQKMVFKSSSPEGNTATVYQRFVDFQMIVRLAMSLLVSTRDRCGREIIPASIAPRACQQYEAKRNKSVPSLPSPFQVEYFDS